MERQCVRLIGAYMKVILLKCWMYTKNNKTGAQGLPISENLEERPQE